MTERFEIEVEAVAGAPWRGVPPDERLRRLLKAMLRSYGYRCTAVRPVERRVVFRALKDGETLEAGDP